MESVMGIVLVAAGIVSLVCWIMIEIKIFKESIGLGILGILCGLFAFIYGWVKVKEYDCKKIMLAWTVAMVVSILANVLGGAALVKSFTDLSEQSGGSAGTEMPADI